MKTKHLLFCLFLLLAVFACRKPFEPAAIKVDYNYLVIEGVINAGPNAVTTITLSRTKNLSDSLPPKPELGAQVLIVGDNGISFGLIPLGNGIYTSQVLNLSSVIKYRLKITTANGSVYQSDFVPVKQTPAIDSLSWDQNSAFQDVTIFAHTHDPKNSTRYYRWEYVETWQYRANYETSYGVDNNNLSYNINPWDSLIQQYNCWASANSTTVVTASSEALGQDVISYAPVATVLHNAEKIAIKYSINVRQFALTPEAYQYWQIIQKSTQQTGTIFDPQPAQLVGNIHCTTNPNEPVIGFVSVSSATEKRIFISYPELINWQIPVSELNCDTKYGAQDPSNFRHIYYPDTSYTLYYYTSGGAFIAAKKDCLDCRRRGGTNLKPSFWQ